MENLKHYYDLIETSIAKLGITVEDARGRDKEGNVQAGKWNLVRGSAKVWIDVWHIEKEKRAYFQVMSPVMKIPVDPLKRVALFEELLMINDKLFSVAFTIYNGWVWLKTIRECENLDESEASSQIKRIGNYADQYDDLLKGKYEPTPDGSQAGAPATPSELGAPGGPAQG